MILISFGCCLDVDGADCCDIEDVDGAEGASGAGVSTTGAACCLRMCCDNRSCCLNIRSQ